MKHSRLLLALLAACSLTTHTARAADENMFLEDLRPPLEQTLGHGHTALWTLPLVATQYQPVQPTPAMLKAIQAQNDGRYLDALIVLDDAAKSGPLSGDAQAEMSLLRASFLLQGSQYQQALELLNPVLANPHHAACAHALIAMTHLQQHRMQEALKAAQQGRAADNGMMLPHLALSYALQGAGRLKEAHAAMHDYNARSPQAITLAREAELALTLDQVQPARMLVARAEKMEAHPYVIAVGGLAHLLDGQPNEAKAAFETALKRDPRDAKALLGLGLAETKLGNLQEGQKKLQAANEAEPHNALILTYLGRAQQQAGQAEAAKASWRSAQQADPKDPTPWLYQAQAALQANRPLEARASVREAQARSANRAVYRGANLLREDEQLLQANLAEIQRQLGTDNLAFHTLADPVGEKSAATLRNQADLLQGQRFGESARRSLLLQSEFNAHPGALPAPLDIFGDGAGSTGAASQQHGEVSAINAQQASYHNYEELFSRHTALEADAVGASKDSAGAQIRAGFGSDTLGFGIAQREYRTDGFARFDNLDNRVMHASVQWRPTQSTQAFLSHQTFNTQHGETNFPADVGNAAQPILIGDDSRLTRLGLRHSLTDSSELRALLSQQQTSQTYDYLDPATGISFYMQPAHSHAASAELQYRAGGADYATQWGAQQTRARIFYTDVSDDTRISQHAYAAWQQALNPQWQVDAQLGWGKIDKRANMTPADSTYLQRWLPRLGVIYTPDSATHVRAAAWHGMGFGEPGDASLAPASEAGILLVRPGDFSNNGKLVHAAALHADRQLNPAWLLEGKIQQRRTDAVTTLGGQQVFYRWQLDESQLALHWQPESRPLAVTAAYEHERFLAPPFPGYGTTDSVQEQRLRALQLKLRWFASAQLTANLAWSRNRTDGLLQTNFMTELQPFQDRFNQVDADLNWQFDRRGALNVGVRNAADRRFQYTDQDRLNPRFSNGKLMYAKLKLAL